MLRYIYILVHNILQYFIPSLFLSFLISCNITFKENFFNDDIIGYYLSAVDINTGESNVLLFDYELDLDSNCDLNLPQYVDIKFQIDVDIPGFTSGNVNLASGNFSLFPNSNLSNRSFSFRNTDMSLEQTFLPGGATLEGGDYTFDPIEGLSSAITSGGRLPNGTYFFKFSINDCPDGYVCNSEINKELNLFIPSFLNSISPGSSTLADTLFNQISIPFPVFQWNSDYCSNCSNYSIRICEFKSNVHSTLEDAINDISILPTGSGYFDIGSSSSNIFQYPSSGFQILNEGSTYVWKVKRSYQTTNGMIEEFSIPFIFKMMNNQPIESTKNLMVNQSKLLKIKNLIGDIKFNEIFDENNGVLKDFDFTSVQIILNDVEKNEDYLDELLELINSSEIEIIEVEVE